MEKSRAEHIQDLVTMSEWLYLRPRSEVEVLMAGDHGYGTVKVITMTYDEMQSLRAVMLEAIDYLRDIPKTKKEG